jgi:SgrR family transcriptional regulator
MSSTRLQQQFIRLWQYYDGRTIETTLEELAQILHCSRRHMRTLISQMQSQGWLMWQAQSGRSKHSTLHFVSSAQLQQQHIAETLLEQDSLEQLGQLLGDKEAMRQALLSQLGRRFRQGKHILRVLYYRSLFSLLPGTMLRRSETHMARQIFSGLTAINEENGEVKADIAHHWQELTAQHWRFYLRPGVLFHHGRELNMQDVISTLQRLQSHPLFSHIQQISSPTHHVIDIHLHSPDHWLPWLLGSVHAMILPAEWQSLKDFASHPIGTGPYYVVHNKPSQLKIRAFEQYFGYRALIDEVNIWVLPELSDELIHSGVQLQTDDSDQRELENRLEEGCYFLLFDQRSPVGSHPPLRQWLSGLLNPIALLNASPNDYQRYWSPAYGLLPRWHHQRPQPQGSIPHPLTQLTITVYRDHSEHQAICQILRTLLAQQNIQLTIQEISYEQWYRGEATSDLWLGSANFTLPIEFSLFATFLELPLLKHCMTEDFVALASHWRQGQWSSRQWAQHLVQSNQLHPLFHHWLVLQGQRSMQGVKMNTLGWFDFKSAWFAPPDNACPFHQDN